MITCFLSSAAAKNSRTWLSSSGTKPAKSFRPPPTARFVPQCSFKKLTKSASERPPSYGMGVFFPLLVSDSDEEEVEVERGKNLTVGYEETSNSLAIPLLCAASASRFAITHCGLVNYTVRTRDCKTHMRFRLEGSCDWVERSETARRGCPGN